MATSASGGSFKSALLVVDMQEDFCPPNGSLAVEGGREIAVTINKLLSLPFTLKIATKDVHPQNHVSFETSHSQPNIKAFESVVTIANPSDKTQTHQIPIWPAHCVEGTKGVEMIPEIDSSRFDQVVEKGKDSRMEMFSGFADVFGNNSSQSGSSKDLSKILKGAGISDVFIVGLAGDYCVKCTALDAKKEGFDVCVVREATKCVDAGYKGWGAATLEMEKAGVNIISIEGSDVGKVASLV